MNTLKSLLNYLFNKGNQYGKLVMLIGVLMAVPLLVLPFYPEEAGYAPAFITPALFSIVVGALITVVAPGHERSAARRLKYRSNMTKGSTPVLFVWCYAILAGSFPFILSEHLPFTLALFESVSGWTTTGLTVVNVAAMPHIFLFHRSFMQYCGGLGFIIMAAMVMQANNAASMYNAEGHSDRLRPSFRGTSKSLGGLYLIWLCLGTGAYALAGMTPFQGICHCMSALSTAGFSTETDSIGAFASVPIDLITIVLMLIGASNFVIIRDVTRFRFRRALRDSEFRFMLLLTLITTLLAAADLMARRGTGLARACLRALFGVVTTFSTTGYDIEDYSGWPAFSLFIIMLLMVVGGCAGSTAGGIKMNRTYFLAKNVLKYIKEHITNVRQVNKFTYYKNQSKGNITPALISQVSGFVSLYLLVLMVGISLTALTSGCGIGDAAFEFTSALGTVGLSCGLTGSDTSTATLVVEMFAMVLGRLEILMVLIGCYNILLDLKAAGGHMVRLLRGGRP